MEKAKLIGIAPQLVVKDVVKTAEYYRDVLGFRLINYVLDPPVYAMMERDGFQVHFGQADGDIIKANDQFRKIAHDFIIWAPEIDRFFEEVTGKGAEIVEGITTRVYGSREFVIRDCDGHKILVSD
ncbi:MAG: VOC family protein [Saprospiraceae bacterium]|nr:VOC family protein [Saprospiraceae bacterium]